MFGIAQTGKFKLKSNGAAVTVKCPGLRVGDEPWLSMVRIANGGAVGKAPLIVADVDKFTVQGDSSDTSTYAWRFKRG